MVSECLKLCAGIGTVVGTLLALRKMLKGMAAPIVCRLDALEEKIDENTKRDRGQINERRVHFRALKVILMKLQGEHINGDFKEVTDMLDECLIENLH